MIDGSEKTFEELYAYYQPRIYSFVFARIKNADDADDVTAQTFLKAYEHRAEYDESRGAFSTWLFSIALNEIKMYFRRAYRRREQTWGEFFESSNEEAPESALLRAEGWCDLLMALEKLTERERQLIELRYWSDMTYREIADFTGLTVTNVGVTLKRAMEKLKKILAVS